MLHHIDQHENSDHASKLREYPARNRTKGRPPMTMQNDQNRRPGFLESATGQMMIVAIIVVVFVSMVIHLL
jgi:hypothetical protein